MHNDLFESISQRDDKEETAENRRIIEIAYELCGRCKLYEKQLRESKKDANAFDIEQRISFTHLLDLKEEQLCQSFVSR